MTILEVLFLALFWAWALTALFFLRQTWLPRQPLQLDPSALNLPAETVRFRATDGLSLEGWKIVADPSHPWILLCHGLGTNRTDLLDIAAGLHQAGFNLFLFDFRGHGQAAGRTTSFGWVEQRDLEGALAFLGQQPDVPAKGYGIYGISMGASVALMTAARDERLAAIAVDSPYPNLDESLGRHLGLLFPMLPREPFLTFIRLTYRLRFGVWPSQASPLEAARALSPRPLLLIAGGKDPRMPSEGTQRLFAAASEPKQLWLIEQAGHLEGFTMNPRRYLSRVTDFFKASLGS